MNTNKAKTSLIFLGDVVILYLSLFITILSRYNLASLEETWGNHFWPFTLIFLIWLLVFYLFELYSIKSFSNRFELLKTFSGATVTSFLISIVAFYIFGSFFSVSPKTNLVIFTIIFIILNLSWRVFLKNVFISKNWIRKILVVGNSPLLIETMTDINKHPVFGYKIEKNIASNLTEKDVSELINFSKTNNVEMVVIDRESAKEPTVSRLAYKLLASGIQTKDVIDFYEEIYRKIPVQGLGEDWFIRELETEEKLSNGLKRIIDFILSLACLIILLPIGVIIAVLIKTTSKGPIVFKQVRVGQNGKVFTLYKFRTMTKDAEKDGAKWALINDVRITPIGKILRHTHLDEMPQLWNIIRGDISFVGPRPERPEFTQKLAQEIPHYEMRHIVKPGLTGWAQINYRYGASIDDAREKLKYDFYYIKNKSIILDLLIMLKTARMIFMNY